LFTLTFYVIIKIIECREKRFELTTLVHRWYPEMRMIQQFCCLIWWKRNLLHFNAVQMAVVCSISLLIKGKCFKACCSCSCWRMRQTIMDNNNIVSFNDTGLTVLILVVNCRPTRLYIRGIRWRYMMEKESVTSTGSLRNYQEIHEKWLNFGSPLG